MKKIGIFGGTFNPPHIAHLIHAESVRSQMRLDKIIFIPSGNPPLKNTGVIHSGHRLNMAKLAFEHNENFEVSDLEIHNASGKSFTVDTLKKLHRLYKKNDIKLYLIIGMDNLIDFPKWKSPEKVITLSEVVVINRPGYSREEVHVNFTKKVRFVLVPSLDISSTMIRKMIKERKSVKYLVPDSVLEYIVQNKLYI
jgi:nicotinate-nucleotide adenylyltransferase